MLIFEDIRKGPRRSLLKVLGVPWVATSRAWMSPIVFAAAGILLAWMMPPGGPPIGMKLLVGVGYGALIYLAEIVHTIGHTVSGRAVGAPMTANILTATLHSNEYAADRTAVARHVHIGRAIGGPLANLVVGLLAAAALAQVASPWIRFFSQVNLLVGAAALLPIPTIDGSVIWRELLRRRER
jgi:Zn-dependent protease